MWLLAFRFREDWRYFRISFSLRELEKIFCVFLFPYKGDSFVQICSLFSEALKVGLSLRSVVSL